MPKRPKKRARSFPTEVLTPEEASALIRSSSASSSTGIRNRALLTCLYRAGLRISEALSLRPKDLDLAKGSMTVLHGKGDKRRTVGLDAGAAAILGLWMERRTKLGLTGRQPVFCTLKGRNIKTPYVRVLLPRLARKAGIEKRVHAHGLRHTHAAELAREHTPLNLIQAQLGHSSLATTDRYLRHIAPEELVRALSARTWKL